MEATRTRARPKKRIEDIEPEPHQLERASSPAPPITATAQHEEAKQGLPLAEVSSSAKSSVDLTPAIAPGATLSQEQPLTTEAPRGT